MFPKPDHRRITELPRAIARLTGEAPPSAAVLRRMATDCRIPIDIINGFYYFKTDDVPTIAVLAKMLRERAPHSNVHEMTTLTLP